MTVTPKPRFALRHVIAYAGGLVVLMAVLLATLAASGLGPEQLQGRASLYCFLETHLYLLLALLPAAVVGEFLLVRRLEWPWWVHVPLMAVVFFVASAAVTALWVAVLFHRRVPSRYLVDVGFQDLIWGSAYWLLLRLADSVLPRARAEAASRPWDFG